MDFIDRMSNPEKYVEDYPEIKDMLLADARFIPSKEDLMRNYASGLPIPFYVSAVGPSDTGHRWIMITIVSTKKLTGRYDSFEAEGFEEVSGKRCKLTMHLRDTGAEVMVAVK